MKQRPARCACPRRRRQRESAVCGKTWGLPRNAPTTNCVRQKSLSGHLIGGERNAATTEEPCRIDGMKQCLLTHGRPAKMPELCFPVLHEQVGKCR
ncbi:hypothetical protein RLOC_00012319 [Lonchura striata]|uniref:Uncharacterized protein n=1 Tax=Lonchura striata TaxID=40157 RepID=A0A218UWY6_9PASE|nr:hypothetical protein RLOC_00012319 [Lonchura striata domestica]